MRRVLVTGASRGIGRAIAPAPHRIAVTSVAPGFIGTERQLAKLDEIGTRPEPVRPGR